MEKNNLLILGVISLLILSSVLFLGCLGENLCRPFRGRKTITTKEEITTTTKK